MRPRALPAKKNEVWSEGQGQVRPNGTQKPKNGRGHLKKRWRPTAGENILRKNPSKIQVRSKAGADFGVKKFNLDF